MTVAWRNLLRSTSAGSVHFNVEAMGRPQGNCRNVILGHDDHCNGTQPALGSDQLWMMQLAKFCTWATGVTLLTFSVGQDVENQVGARPDGVPLHGHWRGSCDGQRREGDRNFSRQNAVVDECSVGMRGLLPQRDCRNHECRRLLVAGTQPVNGICSERSCIIVSLHDRLSAWHGPGMARHGIHWPVYFANTVHPTHQP